MEGDEECRGCLFLSHLDLTGGARRVLRPGVALPPPPLPSGIFRDVLDMDLGGIGGQWERKHVASEAACSAAYWVLDESPAALVPVKTVLQAWHLQNVLFFVYLIVFTANPINKNLSLSKELKHLIAPELGVEVLKKYVSGLGEEKSQVASQWWSWRPTQNSCLFSFLL